MSISTEAVLKKLIEQTQSGVVRWRKECNELGELESYCAAHNHVQFELDSGHNNHLRVNGAIAARGLGLLVELRRAIIAQLDKNQRKDEHLRYEDAIASAAKALGL